MQYRYGKNLQYVGRLVCLVSLMACTTPGESEHPIPSVLVSPGDQDPFDPTQSAQASQTLDRSFFCHPLQLSHAQTIEPDVVKSWSWSADKKTLTLTLDPERRFHDGRKIHAEDLEFALARPFLATVGEAKADPNIEGTDILKKGDSFKPGQVSGIKVLTQDQLQVRLKQPDPDFLYYLASFSTQIIPYNTLQADGATFKGLPVSCGDYRVVDMAPDRSRYRLKKFRGPAAALSEIELWNYDYEKAPSRPDVMMGGLYSPDKIDKTYYRTEKGQEPTVVFTLMLNDKAPIAAQPAFRKAINLAMPRQEMAAARDEIPAQELVLKGSAAFLNLPVHKDIEEAKRLWLTLPSKLREQNYRITIKTNYPGPYFQVIESGFRSIGMKVSMVGKQMKDFKDADAKDVMLGMAFIIMRDNPIRMYQRFDDRQLHPDPFPTFAQPQLQKLLKAYRETLEPEPRRNAAKALAQYVLGENLVIPMSYSRPQYALSPRVTYEAWGHGVDLKNLRMR